MRARSRKEDKDVPVSRLFFLVCTMIVETQFDAIANCKIGRILATAVFVMTAAAFVRGNDRRGTVKAIHVKLWSILCLPILIEVVHVNFYARAARLGKADVHLFAASRAKIDANDHASNAIDEAEAKRAKDHRAQPCAG